MLANKTKLRHDARGPQQSGTDSPLLAKHLNARSLSSNDVFFFECLGIAQECAGGWMNASQTCREAPQQMALTATSFDLFLARDHGDDFHLSYSLYVFLMDGRMITRFSEHVVIISLTAGAFFF